MDVALLFQIFTLIHRIDTRFVSHHSVQPRVIPFPLADMALAIGSTRVGGIVGIVRAGGRGLGR